MAGSKETQIKYPKKHAHHERCKTNEQHAVYSLRSFLALFIIKGRNSCYWQSGILEG